MTRRDTRISSGTRTSKKRAGSPLPASKKRAPSQVSSPRRAPAQERSRETVEAILVAAGRLLVQRGYVRSTTADIARVAGVSIGSFYQYFGDKDAVFNELVTRHHAEVHELVTAHLERFADPRCDPLNALDDLLRELVVLHQKNPPLMRALASELDGLHGQSTPGPHADDGEAVAAIEHILDAREDIHCADPAATAELLVVIMANVSEYLAHEMPDRDPEPILALMRRVNACLLGHSSA